MEYLQSERLLAVQKLHHAFFMPGVERKIEDNFSYKNASRETVFQARRRACDKIGIPCERLTHVYQDHGVEIWTIDASHRGAGALTGENPVGVGDGLITSCADVPLAILVADCLPIFYSTKDARCIGLAHAGWRGTFDDIAGKMVEKMKINFAIDPTELLIWIGPGISRRGFAVGEDVWELFQERWERCGECYDGINRTIDLKQFNKNRLVETGVLVDNIETSIECTFCDLRFFSYRRDGKGSGHNMAVIMREP